MKKLPSFTLLISLLLALLLSGCSGSEERSWQDGQKALSKGNYSEAAAAFQKAGSFQGADQLLRYSQAWISLENGDYANANAAFQALGDFKDCNLMSVYCSAREQEALAQEAFSTGDADNAVIASRKAYQLFDDLSLFLDSDVRMSSCRDMLYSKATEWMNSGRYEDAASCFAGLGSWQNSASYETYCSALALESRQSYMEAAALYSENPDFLDSSSRAEAALSLAYQQALNDQAGGNYESALSAFTALGDYRDSVRQCEITTTLQISTLLDAGSYAETLEKLNLLTDRSAFPEADTTVSGNLTAYLGSFVNAWMNAHADVMYAFFSLSLLQPYLEPDGELDTLVRAEITDDAAPQNYGFVYFGCDVVSLLDLGSGFIAANVTGSASISGPAGYAETQEPMWILLDTRQGNPIVAAVLSV